MLKMSIKQCCNCQDGRFIKDLYGTPEFTCFYGKTRVVSYSGKCVYGLKYTKSNIGIYSNKIEEKVWKIKKKR